MKKLLSALLIAGLVFSGINVYADMQYQNNGVNIGIATKENVKGCTATRVGQIAIVDCTNVTGPITFSGNVTYNGTATFNGASTFNAAANFYKGIGTVNWQSFGGVGGINWQSIPQTNTSGINWSGADILVGSGSAVNWESLRVANGNTSSSLNWQAFGV